MRRTELPVPEFPQWESDIPAVWYLLNNFWEPLEEVVLSGRYNVQNLVIQNTVINYQIYFRPGETGIALLYFLLQEKLNMGEFLGKISNKGRQNPRRKKVTATYIKSSCFEISQIQ